ncbi:MAG: TetR/AcrR family transcriptional regulator [Pseudomonadota bacterium]
MPWDKQFDKEAALDRALDAFWARGFEATSMQDLVDSTGVNRASLYATYGDKRAFFRAALTRYDDRRRRMLADLEAHRRPREAIRQLFLSFARDVDPGGDNRGCFLTNTAIELAGHDAEIRREVAAAQADIEAFFKRLIVAGKKTNEIASHIDATAASRALLAALIGLVVLVRSRPERALLKSVVDEALGRLD